MVATVVSLTSASVTVHYFRREGYGLGAAPANDDGADDYYARKDDEHRNADHWRAVRCRYAMQSHLTPYE